jgi:hypothetical protein
MDAGGASSGNGNTSVIPQEPLTLDEVYVNVKILGKVLQHEKLCIRDDRYIDRDRTPPLIQPITRMLNNENRGRTIAFVEHIIEAAFGVLDSSTLPANAS